MSQSNISIRIDDDLKHRFDSLCDELGLTMSSAINLFIKAVVRERGIPFALSINDYNEKTRKVIENANNGIDLSETYNSVDEMMKDILEDN